MSKGFDVSTLAQSDTVTIQLVHPATGEEIGATATVYGQDSAICKAESDKVGDKCADWSAKHRGKTIPNALYKEYDKRKVVNCVKSIDGLTEGGNPLVDVADILERFPFFHEQIVGSLTDRSLFIKDSSAK